jgi:preprotein translocase subunit SecB
MLSPLQLRQHSLLELTLKECEASPDDPASNWIPAEPHVQADIATAVENPYLCRIHLVLKSRDRKSDDTLSAWDFAIRLSGVFEFTDQAISIEQARKLAFVNGTSMLYGMARDILNSVSLRGQKPSILLPSLNFQALAGRIDDQSDDPKKSPTAPTKRKSVKASVLVASEPSPKAVKKPKARVASAKAK